MNPDDDKQAVGTELEPLRQPNHFHENTIEARNNPVVSYLASLGSITSRKTQEQSIDFLSRTLFNRQAAEVPWHLLTFAELSAIRSWLAQRYAPATATRVLCAIRRILKHAWRLGLLSHQDYLARSDLPSITGSRLPGGRSLATGELKTLFGSIDLLTAIGARNAAMLTLLYGAGLRRAEASCALRENYNYEIGSLRIIGKGNKERLVFLPPGGPDVMSLWLTYRGDDDGPLLYPIVNGELIAKKMSLESIRSAVAACASRAGIPHMSTHDLRRTYVGDMLEAGVDLGTVQKLVGHASPTTTSRYDRRPDAARQRAVERIFVPCQCPPTSRAPKSILDGKAPEREPT